MHTSSVRPSRSRSTSRDSRIVTTTPEACSGWATLSGSNDSTTSWSTIPIRISANPASQPRAVNSVRTSDQMRCASMTGR